MRGFAGIRGEDKFNRVQAGTGGELVVGHFSGVLDAHIELALLEAEVGELGDDGFAQLGHELLALCAKIPAGFEHLAVQLGDTVVDEFQFSIAAFELAEFLSGFGTEGDDVGQRGTVFALEGVDEVQALLDFREAFRVDVHAVGVLGERVLEIVERGDGGFVLFGERSGGGIDALQFVQGAPDGTKLVHHIALGLGEHTEGVAAEFDEAGGVRAALVFFIEAGFFLRLQASGGDLVRLMAEEVELLCVGAFVHDEVGLLRFEFLTLFHQGGELGAGFSQAAEGVENLKLLGRVQQRLMIVGTVHVHQPFAERAEGIERGG